MNNALMPLYIMVADYVTQLALWIQSNPEIAAGIAAVRVGLYFIGHYYLINTYF